MKSMNLIKLISASVLAFTSMTSLAEVSSPPDASLPVDCNPNYPPLNSIKYTYRVSASTASALTGGTRSDCPTDATSLEWVSVDVVRDYFDTIIPYTMCSVNDRRRKLTCYGSPVSSEVALTYTWTTTGPIQASTTMQAPITSVVKVECTGLGIGTISLTVTSGNGAPAKKTTRSVNCT